jgi:5-methylcytosine-specific restriction endonuclease McrA
VASDVTDALRAEVARRSNYRREYCLIQEDDAGFHHQVDHVLSRKHGGVSSLENLAYACILCNRRKGSDLASVDSQTGTIIALFHPRRD